MQRESVEAPVLRPALFDRFEANRESTGQEDLVRQVADRVRARRADAPQTSGVGAGVARRAAPCCQEGAVGVVGELGAAGAVRPWGRGAGAR